MLIYYPIADAWNYSRTITALNLLTMKIRIYMVEVEGKQIECVTTTDLLEYLSNTDERRLNASLLKYLQDGGFQSKPQFSRSKTVRKTTSIPKPKRG